MMFTVPTPADQYDPEVADATTIEPKVRAATAAASTAAGVIVPAVLWLIAQLAGVEVPVALQGLVGLLITGALTFAAGYFARHVDRLPVL